MPNVLSFSDVMNVVNGYAAKHASTQMGHNFVCVVSLKESRVYAGGRHLIGHVAKATMVNHCLFPKYDSKVASVMGMSPTPGQLKGMTWVNYPYIKKADRSGFNYLNIYYGISDERMTTTTKWLYDGREATQAEVAEIERWLKPTDNSRGVKAAMYQIDPVYKWDGFHYFGEEKSKAIEIYEKIGK